MAQLKDKVQDALDELRMLVLGIQVLVGVDYRAVLEPGFDRLPHAIRVTKLASLSLLLLAFAIVISPGAVHRIGERGEDSPQLHRFVTICAGVALLPFAAALSLDFVAAAFKAAGPRASIVAPIAAGMISLATWYGIELIARAKVGAGKMDSSDEKTEIKDKIRHVLTEARVVLPGAQALLGFQFASTLVDGFDRLSPAMKELHLASLSCIALATIILIAPAAWHRLVERGELTERFHRVASIMVLIALIPLALGLLGDFYVVAMKITESPTASGAMAASFGAVFVLLWFGIGLARRRTHGSLSIRRPAHAS